MAIDTLRRFGVFAVLWLAQALVLNQIHLFGCAMPLLYVYFVIIFPRNYPKWAILLWCFFLGLCLDMFSNTPGMAAASLTLAGAVQPYLLELFIPRDATENIKSSAATLGLSKFLTLTIIIVTLYCLVFFSIEAFTFFNWLQWLMNIGGSSVVTILLIMTIETIRK